MVARACTTPFLFHFPRFACQFLHQLNDLVAGVARHVPDLRVSQSFLASLGTVLEHAQYACFGGLPVDAAALFGIAVCHQACRESWVKAPVSAAAATAVLYMALVLHAGEKFAGLRLATLAEARCRGGVHLGILQEMLEKQQLIDPQGAAAFIFFGHELAKGCIELALVEDHRD